MKKKSKISLNDFIVRNEDKKEVIIPQPFQQPKEIIKEEIITQPLQDSEEITKVEHIDETEEKTVVVPDKYLSLSKEDQEGETQTEEPPKKGDSGFYPKLRYVESQNQESSTSSQDNFNSLNFIRKEETDPFIFYLDQGIHYLHEKEFKLAEQVFRDLIETHPEVPDFYAYLGWTIYLNPEKDLSERIQEGIKYNKKAIDLDSKNYKAHLFLGRIYKNDKKKYLAKTYFLKAAELSPESEEAKNELKDLYTISEDQETLPTYEDYIDKDQYLLSETYLNEGLDLLESGNFKGAVKCFKKVIEKTPDSAIGYIYLGWSTYKDKSTDKNEAFKKAVKYIKKGLSIDPKNGEAYLFLGKIYLENGEDDMAELYLGKALEFNKDCKEARLEIQKILDARRKKEKF